MRRSLLAALPLALAALAPREAAAQTVPSNLVDRDVVLPPSVTELRGDVRLGLSARDAGDVAVVAPSLLFGVSDTFTLGVLHTRENYLGDGGSFCVGRACGGVHYGQVALDGKYVVLKEPKASLAIHGAVEGYAFDPLVSGIRVGMTGKVLASRDAALFFDPSLFLGITNRSTLSDSLLLPVRAAFRASKEVSAFVDTGLYFDGVGRRNRNGTDLYGRPYGSWRLPLGAGVLFAPNSTVDLSARFAFLGVLNGYRDYGSFAGRELVLSIAFHL